MEEKMTSGEIAKKTGVSQKAIRLYDEKGLLKPTDYSEGNYRLYDKNSLLVLEKIIALKEVGFSLEEIKENLSQQSESNAYEALEQQIQIMEEKKNKLEKSIACIKNAMERCKDKNDWDSVAEVIRTIMIDQGADERHFDALKFTVDEEPWYVKIYRSMDIRANEKVLDLGCGFGKLWRENWEAIPEGVKVDAYDLHGSWAENFAEFTEDNKAKLASNADIVINWADLEESATWDCIDGKAYNRIIAYYLFGFLKNDELLLERVSKALAEDGVFCCTGISPSKAHLYWKQMMGELKLDTGFISSKISSSEKEAAAFDGMLGNYFASIEKYELLSTRCYKNAEDAFKRLESVYGENNKVLRANEAKIKDYLETKISNEGELLVEESSVFCKCSK